MGLIKEPLNVDFYVTGKEMTTEDHKRVSDYIKSQKEKKGRVKSIAKRTGRKSAAKLP